MTSFLRNGLLALTVGFVGLPFGVGDGQVQAASTNDYNYDTWLTPQAPRIGDTYTLFIRVHNTSGWPMVFRGQVTKLPSGDGMISAARQEQMVRTGESFTFRFDIQCGVLGGTVNYDVRAFWVDE